MQTPGDDGMGRAEARTLAVGDRVRLRGLTKAAEHNGKLGTVVGSQGERFKVQLDADSKGLALKEANLERLPGGAAPSSGAASQPTRRHDAMGGAEGLGDGPETTEETDLTSGIEVDVELPSLDVEVSRGAAERVSTAGLWDGIRFEFKLAFPVDFTWKLLRNGIIMYGHRLWGRNETGEAVVDALKEETAKILEAIGALRTAKLKTALDKMKTLFELYQSYLDELATELNSANSGMLAREAEKVRDLADEAFNTVGTANEKILAVKLAMMAASVEGAVGTYDAKRTGIMLRSQLRKLLRDGSVKALIGTQLNGGGGLLSSRKKREGGLRDLLLIATRERVFALDHGLRADGDEPAMPLETCVKLLSPDSKGYVRSFAETPLEVADEELGALLQGTKTQAAETMFALWIKIGVQGAKGLAEALKVNTTVTKLSLWGNQISDQGAKSLAEALKVNTTVTELGLGRNQIGDQGAKSLAEALKVNTTVTELYLSVNQIGDQGAKSLAEALKVNTTVTKLWLWNNQIGHEGAKSLAEALKVNTTVTKLGLGSNQLGDQGAKSLAEALKVNPTVTELNLSDNQIGDQGAKSLAEALKVNTTVTELNLRNNQIGHEGAKSLAEALKVNTTVTELYLGGNQIGDQGAKSLAEARKINTTVTKLDLGTNQIGNQGAKSLAEARKVKTGL